MHTIIRQCVLLVLAALCQPVRSGAAQGGQGVPTPESVLGFRVGADFNLASYDESIAYFQRLSATSDRVQLREIGRTSEGRRWYIALISTAENLANVERYIPVEVRLDFYGLSRLVNKMSQDKLSGDMLIKNDNGDTILRLGITDGESTLDREPGAAS